MSVVNVCQLREEGGRPHSLWVILTLKDEFMKGMVPEVEKAGADIISRNAPWHTRMSSPNDPSLCSISSIYQ